MTYYPEPLTLDEWRALKAATRHRRYVERQIALDEGDREFWAAVERDTLTDPHELERPVEAI